MKTTKLQKYWKRIHKAKKDNPELSYEIIRRLFTALRESQEYKIIGAYKK